MERYQEAAVNPSGTLERFRALLFYPTNTATLCRSPYFIYEVSALSLLNVAVDENVYAVVLLFNSFVRSHKQNKPHTNRIVSSKALTKNALMPVNPHIVINNSNSFFMIVARINYNAQADNRAWHYVYSKLWE